MRLNQRSAQLGQTGLVVFVHQKLIWICATVMPHSHGFATPNQLSTAQTEISPASGRRLTWFSINRSVPTFHRMNAEAIANLLTGNAERVGERRLHASFQIEVTRNRKLQIRKMRFEVCNGTNASNGWV